MGSRKKKKKNVFGMYKKSVVQRSKTTNSCGGEISSISMAGRFHSCKKMTNEQEEILKVGRANKGGETDWVSRWGGVGGKKKGM